MVRLSRPESVLEHTGMVVLLCYLIRNQIFRELQIDIPIGRLLAKATVHDIDELVTGDLPRPTKYSSPEVRAALTKLERSGVAKVAALINDQSIEEHHLRAKDGDDGLIVSIADLLCACYKIWDEVIMQNNYLMVRQAIHVQQYVQERIHKLKQLNTPISKFLLGLLLEAKNLAAQAAEKDHPSHGCIKEEIFQNGN